MNNRSFKAVDMTVGEPWKQILNSVVKNASHLVHRYIIALWETPVVLYLYSKCGIEWVMGIACDANVV
ncbi:MAG: hypothetical protein K6G72_13745, partial [Lachnospiraceae bacterium]|nr:hypothetical protein [Lachnospiraceae bacterium]